MKRLVKVPLTPTRAAPGKGLLLGDGAHLTGSARLSNIIMIQLVQLDQIENFCKRKGFLFFGVQSANGLDLL